MQNDETALTVESFQARVRSWMMECFGYDISSDKLERCDRFIEEALELLQASNYPKDRAYALIEYVYGRDEGEINQEVGGVMVTLAAHCLAFGVDMHEAGETELARILQPEIVKKIRAKQAAKPTGSALPLASLPNPRNAALEEALLTVVNATRAYLPPDGITAQECLNRVIGATDNPEINPIIKEIENGRS